ncbi:TPA: hypothetical protein DEO28_02605 [Candidatus Dependentiae bacterium]|nr:MAG: hypothetical protein UR14_C0005G0122 [candidate division TM6 bacterium GW2011_GWE2_31_21]KKP53199.1 MAG: hypothetical protein UR43_C0007G0123 [candidate division TM6 bacterium GW2011_GWF2_33_332]HBS48017.1 hypothetical protein [Candidatus Dependentiae bacterium]HBZ73379.1 hypothetical protein [Candidatus Dependentiae bacterium]
MHNKNLLVISLSCLLTSNLLSSDKKQNFNFSPFPDPDNTSSSLSYDVGDLNDDRLNDFDYQDFLGFNLTQEELLNIRWENTRKNFKLNQIIAARSRHLEVKPNGKPFIEVRFRFGKIISLMEENVIVTLDKKKQILLELPYSDIGIIKQNRRI